MIALLLTLAFLSLAVLVAYRIAASPTYQLLSCAFGGWAEHCRQRGESATGDDDAAARVSTSRS